MSPRAIVFGFLATAGCQRTLERLDFERMRDQARLDVYDADPTFPDGSTMRLPPGGTVPRERVLGDPALTTGVTADGEVTEIPIALDLAVLERGRDRFERFCGACHGLVGTGNPRIIENASLRPPPSLHEPRIRRQPPGRIFRTVTEGFGLMPAYSDVLGHADRWAVVAYLRVLWRSQSVELATLDPDVRAQAEAALAQQEAR